MSRDIGLSFDLSMNNKKFSRTILVKDRQPAFNNSSSSFKNYIAIRATSSSSSCRLG